MKKILLALVAMLALSTVEASAQGAFRELGREMRKQQEKIRQAQIPKRGNAIRIGVVNGITRYMTGWYRSVYDEDTKDIGEIACGYDKNGRIWVVNHTSRRLIVEFYYYDHSLRKGATIQRTLDPGEYENPDGLQFKEFKEFSDYTQNLSLRKILK